VNVTVEMDYEEALKFIGDLNSSYGTVYYVIQTGEIVEMLSPEGLSILTDHNFIATEDLIELINSGYLIYRKDEQTLSAIKTDSFKFIELGKL
jgi:hypothetical protein